MGGEWSKVRLSDVCAYIGRGIAPAYIESGGLLVLNQKCIRNQRVNFQEARRTQHDAQTISPEKVLRQWDVLVNSTGVGTLGRVAQINQIPELATVDSHITIVRPNPKHVNPRFFGAVIRAFEHQIESLGEGSTGQTELPRSRLASFVVPIAPGTEQPAIAYVIGALDDKIELNRRMNETLDAITRAFFKSWFVDFDPIRAKIHKCVSGLADSVSDIFPGRLVDSRVGKIPEGWGTAPLEEHFNVAKGVSYKGSGLTDSGMPLHNLNSVYEGGGYKYEGIKYYAGEFSERHQVSPGDVIVANTEQGHDRLLIGYAAVVPRLFGERGIASHHIFRLRPRSQSPLTATYVYHLLNSSRMHQIVSGYANGTTVNMLPIDGLQKPIIVVPPRRLVEAFDDLAVRSELRREELVGESTALIALRETLLPKLVMGELRTKNVGGNAGRIGR